LPNEVLDIREELREAGRSEEEIDKTIKTTGVKSVHVEKSKPLSEFIFQGLSATEERHKGLFNDLDSIIVVSQSYDNRIPSISTRVQEKLNLSNDTFCIDIMDGCAGYIKALALTKMLQNDGYKKTLILSGDLNSIMTSKAEIGTKILFGDGISATFIEPDDSENLVKIFNNGDNDNIISCSAGDNLMNMNGFEVFRFTKNMVPKLIKDFLAESSHSLDSFDLVGLHQASRLVVSTICNNLRYSNQLCEDFLCGDIGNLGAGSLGAWLSQVKELPQQSPLKMLAVGFGSGLSWGVASLNIDLHINEVINV